MTPVCLTETLHSFGTIYTLRHVALVDGRHKTVGWNPLRESPPAEFVSMTDALAFTHSHDLEIVSRETVRPM